MNDLEVSWRIFFTMTGCEGKFKKCYTLLKQFLLSDLVYGFSDVPSKLYTKWSNCRKIIIIPFFAHRGLYKTKIQKFSYHSTNHSSRIFCAFVFSAYITLYLHFIECLHSQKTTKNYISGLTNLQSNTPWFSYILVFYSSCTTYTYIPIFMTYFLLF